MCWSAEPTVKIAIQDKDAVSLNCWLDNPIALTLHLERDE
jgi:hypothetical protein